MQQNTKNQQELLLRRRQKLEAKLRLQDEEQFNIEQNQDKAMLELINQDLTDTKHQLKHSASTDLIKKASQLLQLKDKQTHQFEQNCIYRQQQKVFQEQNFEARLKKAEFDFVWSKKQIDWLLVSDGLADDLPLVPKYKKDVNDIVCITNLTEKETKQMSLEQTFNLTTDILTMEKIAQIDVNSQSEFWNKKDLDLSLVSEESQEKAQAMILSGAKIIEVKKQNLSKLDVLLAVRLQILKNGWVRIFFTGHTAPDGSWNLADGQLNLQELVAMSEPNTAMTLFLDQSHAGQWNEQHEQAWLFNELNLMGLQIYAFTTKNKEIQWNEASKLFQKAQKFTPFSKCGEEFVNQLKEHVDNYGFVWSFSSKLRPESNVLINVEHSESQEFDSIMKIGFT